MDLPDSSGEDVLAQRTRARIFALLVEGRAPMSTDDLAGELGLHVNGVRRHLERLHESGLVERRHRQGATGRPGDKWLVAADARPGGKSPSGYGDLALWLARAMRSEQGGLHAIERAGRKIGSELAPDAADDPVEGFRSAFAALGFQPAIERRDDGGFSCRLENCPYRDSALENPDVVCTLHRGITTGLLEVLDPEARLTRFERRDPRDAGCLVEVERPGDA